MVKFEKPMVEFIALDNAQVLYSSPVWGGVQSCKGSFMPDPDRCGEDMVASQCMTEAWDELGYTAGN